MLEIKKISVLGCGWFGLPFAKSLIEDGYQINGSTTSSEKLSVLQDAGIKPYLINATTQQFDAKFFDCDLLFINIPPRKKVDDVSLYPEEIKSILANASSVQWVIFISSTGIYEDGNFKVDEGVNPNPNTAAGQKLYLAEQVVLSSAIPNKTIIRFAGLIGKSRNLAKFFAGRTDVENGEAPVNLIALEDAIHLSKAIIRDRAFDRLYHGVHPDHPTRKAFYSALCEASAMSKPVFLSERKSWKQVDSKHIPMLNFEFEFSSWKEWIAARASSL